MVGNKPNFSGVDVLSAFLLLTPRPQSRLALVQRLSLGEGTVRSILDILKHKGLLDSTQEGHYLSRKGARLAETMRAELLQLKDLTLSQISQKSTIGALIRKSDTKTSNIELRDLAIRNGALGALFFTYVKDLELSGSDMHFKAEYKAAYEEILRVIPPQSGNVLVVIYADTFQAAMRAVLSVAVEMSQALKKAYEQLL